MIRTYSHEKGSCSPEGLNEAINRMISGNVIELVDGAYKIKPNQDENLNNDQNFVENIQQDPLKKPLAAWSGNRKLPLFPKEMKHHSVLLINHKPLKDL